MRDLFSSFSFSKCPDLSNRNIYYTYMRKCLHIKIIKKVKFIPNNYAQENFVEFLIILQIFESLKRDRFENCC